MKKRVLLIVLVFTLVFSLIPAALAEGSDTPSPSEQPTVSEEPVVTPEPTEEPTEEPTTEPDTITPLTADAVLQGKASGEFGISSIGSGKERSDAQQKLSTSLLQLTDSRFLPSGLTQSKLINRMETMEQVRVSAASSGVENDISGLDVFVYIRVKEGCSLDIVEPYVSQIDSEDETIGLCAAWVKASSIEALASLDGVAGIREVYRPKVYAGDYTSEGDAMLNADDVRNILHADGTGVKVGILSDGVNNWTTARDSGDLPASVNVLSDTVGGDEGTAMLEIVHDLAPGAELYFHDCGDTTMDFCSAIDDLVAAGCTVICDDIGWIGEPFFEDGDVADHVADVLAAHPEIIYTSSAGNAAYDHYQGAFVRANSGGLADFSRTGRDSFLYVEVPAHTTATIIMEWNDPFGSSSNDYDLEIYDYRTRDYIDGSYDVQNGDDDPIEGISYTNSSSYPQDIFVAAWKESGYTRTLELYMYNCNMYANNRVKGDSIFGHPAVPGVIACGAIDGNSADGSTYYNKLEYFSSRGPVTMLGGVVRKKPDICGIDGVSVTGAGTFPSTFYGTSAASPHIAAVAALLMDRFNGDKTAAEIRKIIVDNRTDMGTVGYDYLYGWGKSDALAAVKSWNYVTFDSQEGSATPATQLVARKKTVTVPTAPTKDNLILEGWYTSTDFASAHKWNFSTSTVTADMTLYANWVHRVTATPNSKYYGTVTGGGNYRDGVAVTLKATPKQGYRFVGWMEGTTVVTTNADYTFTPTTADRTFVAQFAKIGTPVISAITSQSYNTVKLDWGAVDGATGYYVYRATSKYGTYRYVAAVPGDVTYTNTVPKSGVRYYYKVRAYCTTTTLTTTIPTVTTYGSRSGYKYATPNWIKPKLTAARLNYHSVKLTWDDVRDADSYIVYRSTSYAGTYYSIGTATKEAGATSLEYTVEMTKSMIGKTYYYKVRPVDDNGVSQVKGLYSNYAAAKASWQKLYLTASTLTYHSISLDWNDVEDADYYYIWRSTYNGNYKKLFSGTEPLKVSSSEYVDDGLTKGRTYYYKVQPIDETLLSTVGEGVPSGYKYAKADWPKLNLTAKTKNYYSVALSWNAIEGADHYLIWRSTYDGGYQKLLNTDLSPIKVTTTSYIDEVPVKNKYYYYKVQPVDETTGGDVAGPRSSYKYAKAAWPALGLKAVSGGYDSVNLNWNDIDAVDAYQVYYKPSGGTYIKTGGLITVSNATVTGLTAGTTYYFKIEATDNDKGVTYMYSSYAYAKPIPAKPTNLNVVKASSTSMTVTWDAVTGANGYQVYRATSKYGTYSWIATTTDLTSVTSTGLRAGRTYYYKVRAYVGSPRVYGYFTAPIGLKL